ncbi:MAG: PEP-CTERM sorting domain-containing protein [Pyrinomonadaceae bacterium]
MITRKNLLASLFLIVLGVVAASPTRADVVQLTNPSQLGAGNATVTLPSGVGNPIIPSPLLLTAGGRNVTLNLLRTDSNRSFQAFVNSTEFSFPPGTTLLDTLGNDPLQIDFAGGVTQFALRAQSNTLGAGMFIFTAFNGNTAFGPFSVAFSDTAVSFIGVGATGGDIITRLVLTSAPTSGVRQGFSFGQISIAPAAATAVPEPATMTLLGIGLAGAAVKLRRRRSK